MIVEARSMLQLNNVHWTYLIWKIHQFFEKRLVALAGTVICWNQVNCKYSYSNELYKNWWFQVYTCCYDNKRHMKNWYFSVSILQLIELESLSRIIRTILLCIFIDDWFTKPSNLNDHIKLVHYSEQTNNFLFEIYLFKKRSILK